MLMEEGKKLTDKMWKVCEAKQGSSIAKNEFGPLMDHFLKYSALQPGTHVSKVAEAAEHANAVHLQCEGARPRARVVGELAHVWEVRVEHELLLPLREGEPSVDAHPARLGPA